MSIRTVLVCGAGLMGHGIAQVCAAAGRDAFLFEPDRSRTEAGIARIRANLDRQVAEGRTTPEARDETLRHVRIADALGAAAAMADLVIEAVYEDEAVKRSLFTEVDHRSPEHTIVASNTSSISITRLATALRPPRRQRFIGMHFASPVPETSLVELIRAPDTVDETEAEVRELADALGRHVIVSRDRPGFIVDRILMPQLVEAMRAYDEGLASAEDIDAGARLGLRHPMGPLEYADFIGLDVCLQVMEVLFEGYRQPQFAPPPVLRQMIDAGYLGQKSGRGFYRYPRENAPA